MKPQEINCRMRTETIQRGIYKVWKQEKNTKESEWKQR